MLLICFGIRFRPDNKSLLFWSKTKTEAYIVLYLSNRLAYAN